MCICVCLCVCVSVSVCLCLCCVLSFSVLFLLLSSFLIAVDDADDVGALVFDIGTNSTKAGYAGEDTPKVRGKNLHSMLLLLLLLLLSVF